MKATALEHEMKYYQAINIIKQGIANCSNIIYTSKNRSNRIQTHSITLFILRYVLLTKKKQKISKYLCIC